MISRTLLIASLTGLCLAGVDINLKTSKVKTGAIQLEQTEDPYSFQNLGAVDMTVELVVNGLARPVQVLAAPNDYERIFIVEQRSGSTGRVRIYNLVTGQLYSTPFLSQSVSTSSEQGLLGMAFHPNYESN